MCVVVWVFILFGKVACCSFFFSFYTGCTFFTHFFFFLFCCIALIVANFHFTLGRVAFSDSRQSVRQSLEAQSTKQKLHERSAPPPLLGRPPLTHRFSRFSATTPRADCCLFQVPMLLLLLFLLLLLLVMMFSLLLHLDWQVTTYYWRIVASLDYLLLFLLLPCCGCIGIVYRSFTRKTPPPSAVGVA